MNKNLTEIVMVVDRSGSMSSVQTDAQAGINKFIEDQKAAPGDAKLTLVQFDTSYDVIHDGAPIKDVGPFSLVPGGWTALYDAIGRAIDTVGQRLDKTPEADRPGAVIFVIVTDGLENSSKEYRGDRITRMVKHQKDVYNWQFIYIGADPTGVTAATNMGVSAAAQYNPAVPQKAYKTSSDKVLKARHAVARGQAITSANFAFSSDEQADLMDASK